MRCAACGASNPPEAGWCNQCLAPVRASVTPDEAPSPDHPDADTSGADDAAAGPSAGALRSPEETTRATSGPAGATSGVDEPGIRHEIFRRRDGEVEWACPRCGTYTHIEQPACAACGTDMTAHFESAEPADDRQQPQQWTAALWLSAVAPGAGHLLINRVGTGLARVLLFVVWLGGGWAMLRADGPGGPVAAPLLLGAAVIWAGSLADLVFLARGGRELLAGRVLLWLVVGVTGLALLGALSGAAMLTT